VPFPFGCSSTARTLQLTVTSGAPGEPCRGAVCVVVTGRALNSGQRETLGILSLREFANAERALSRADQRLLNWKRLRAPAKPYFLRSLIRGSRVRSPRALSIGWKRSSIFTRARARP